MNQNTFKRILILMLIFAMIFSFPMQIPSIPDSVVSIMDEETPLGTLLISPKNYDSGYGVIWYQDPLIDPTMFTAKRSDAESSDSNVLGTSSSVKLTIIGNKSDRPLLTGLTRSAAENLLGSPINKVGNLIVSNLSSPTKGYYQLGDGIVILHFDAVAPDKVIFATLMPSNMLLKTNFLSKLNFNTTATMDTEKMTVDLLNQVRIAYGKAPLVMDEKLTVVSRMHSQTMVDGNYFSHTNLSGLSPKARIQAAQIPFRSYGEALTAGTWTPMDAITAWMNSPGHRAIILGDYTSVGIGIASGTSKYGIFFTLNAIKK